MATVTQNYGAYTTLSVTSLNTLLSNAANGWQSDLIDNISSVRALDYKLYIGLSCSNIAPANDKAAYVYLCPATSSATWDFSDGGTTTIPSGTNGLYTVGSTNNLKLAGVLSYTAQNQRIQGEFNALNAFGSSMPDGFSVILVNFTGTQLGTGGNVVAYRALKRDVA